MVSWARAQARARTYLLARTCPRLAPHCLQAGPALSPSPRQGVWPPGNRLALEASVIPALLPAGPRGQEAGAGEPGGQVRPHFTGGGRRDCTEVSPAGSGLGEAPSLPGETGQLLALVP